MVQIVSVSPPAMFFIALDLSKPLERQVHLIRWEHAGTSAKRLVLEGQRIPTCQNQSPSQCSSHFLQPVASEVERPSVITRLILRGVAFPSCVSLIAPAVSPDEVSPSVTICQSSAISSPPQR